MAVTSACIIPMEQHLQRFTQEDAGVEDVLMQWTSSDPERLEDEHDDRPPAELNAVILTTTCGTNHLFSYTNFQSLTFDFERPAAGWM